MCSDYFDGCEVSSPNWIDCNYLPSLNEDILCFYKPISCSNPPTVEHATLSTHYERGTKYSLFDTVVFTCDEGFEMIGNNTIYCNHSGQLSTPPQCFLNNTSTASAEFKPTTESSTESVAVSTVYSLVVILPISLFLLATLFLVVAVRYKIKLKAAKKLDLHKEHVEDDNILTDLKQIDEPLLPLRKQQYSIISLIATALTKRNREFDTFVLYCFDSDDDFVINYLLPELEETRAFKLCIHSRNFTPGRDIKDNIEEAIGGSNSAIIIMSPGFVDSMWCKEEFTHCYIENMKDAAFNLFVIIMQPADTLVNISPYMKTFFANKTYLQVNDPELFTKLATHLEIARKPQNGNDENYHEVSSDEL